MWWGPINPRHQAGVSAEAHLSRAFVQEADDAKLLRNRALKNARGRVFQRVVVRFTLQM